MHVEGSVRADRLVAGRALVVGGTLEIDGRAVFPGGLLVRPPPEPEGAPDEAPAAPSAPLVLEGLHLDVPTRHADAILAAFRGVGWTARDTGKTVSTDDDEAALTTIVVDIRAPAAAAAPAPPAPTPTGAPFVRRALLALGDLVVGEECEGDLDLAATGSVTIGRNACLAGRVRAGGDLRLLDGAVVGDVACGGELALAPGARVSGSVEAGKGVAAGSEPP